MKICWFGFLGKNHSWSVVAQNICRELINKGHHVDLFSTNGNLYFPDDLKPYLKGFVEEGSAVSSNDFINLVQSKLDCTYDMQLSYTALPNFAQYFIRGNTNRFGIWNYETTVLPTAFPKFHKYVDKMLPSSNFSKKIFTDNGIPADHQIVIHHGIHIDKFNNSGVYPLKTKKKYKILCNIAQPHLRKNIPNLLKAYGLAFNKNDNVCLVLKVSRKSANNAHSAFDINFNEVFTAWKKKFKNHAEVEIIDQFIVDIETLYNACDIVWTMANTECFWMPGLEGFAANKLVIAPRYGGQLDYMTDENSLLIDGKVIRADMRMQYWEPSPYASVFDPDVTQAAAILKDVISNYSDYLNKFSPKMKELIYNFTWSKVTDNILQLCG
jgi:glycosyltransferase involved in cell wall biosynthesis